MAANSGNNRYHYWAGKYGNCGHIYSPGGQRGPFEHLPYGLDNGAYSAYEAGRDFDFDGWVRLLEWARAAEIPPLWVAVPDVVTQAEATRARWAMYAPKVRGMGFKAALVVQDGMTPDDVKRLEPDVVFVGGSTTWKWLWLWRFCESHPRVHVGRVNGYEPLLRCYHAGAESCDGTGWFRGNQDQLEMLRRFLEEQASGSVPSYTGQFPVENP